MVPPLIFDVTYPSFAPQAAKDDETLPINSDGFNKSNVSEIVQPLSS